MPETRHTAVADGSDNGAPFTFKLALHYSKLLLFILGAQVQQQIFTAAWTDARGRMVRKVHQFHVFIIYSVFYFQ